MSNKFVQKLKSLAELSAKDVAAIQKVTSITRSLPAKVDLTREGDRPGSVFIMLEGWACRYKTLPSGARQIMAFLMPGDACDLHTGMLTQMDHSIKTITPSRVAGISRQEMDALMHEHRGVARAMYLAQLTDESTFRAWIVSMGRRNSIERVPHLICELYFRAHWIGLIKNDWFELPFSQIVLADALGMTPVHINHVLKCLRVAGVLESRRGSAVVTSPAILVKIAGFDENYLHRRLRQTG